MAKVEVHVLDVGQGACNYIEIYNDAGVVTNNMLIDLGTNSKFAIATQNINYLIAAIQARAAPQIDVLILTHGDTDHFNLMSRLFPALVQGNNSIGVIWFGGQERSYLGLIAALRGYCQHVF